MHHHFPRTLKAAESGEQYQWAIGDALLKEAEDQQTGPRGLRAVEKELNDNGIEISVNHLGRLRRVAEAFPAARRHKLPWTVHEFAGNPDTLDVIVKAARKSGHKVTKWYVAEIQKQLRHQQHGDQLKAKAEAKAEVEKRQAAERRLREKMRTISDKVARERAAKEVREAAERRHAAEAQHRAIKIAPKATRPAPSEDEVPHIVVSADMRVQLSNAAAALKEATKLAEKHGADFKEVNIHAFVERALEMANGWRRYADLLRRHTTNKRGHLSVVNE